MRSGRILTGLAFGLALLMGGIAEAATTVRFATTIPEGENPETKAMKALKSFIELRSGGELQVELFFGGALGGDREILEQVQNNALQIAAMADGAVANFYPDIQVLAIPYLFDSSAHAAAFLNDSPYMKAIYKDMMAKSGLRTVAVAEGGFRNLTNNVRPIHGPDDMKGLKMRTMESPVFMAFMKSLGAAATPIAFNELIMSLKQGVVDGQENAANTVLNYGLAEVQKFMSLNEHIYSPVLTIVNEDFLGGLDDGQRRVVIDGMKLYATVNSAEKLANLNRDLAALKGKGMEIYVTSPEEKAKFRAITQPAVIEFIAGRVGKDKVDALLAAVDDTRKELYAK